MKIKCDWCGSWINDFDQVCPNCGGVNNNYNRHANGVPQTIEELKAWAKEMNLPLQDMRTFIGEDYKGAKAFGIYKAETDGTFVVNKKRARSKKIEKTVLTIFCLIMAALSLVAIFTGAYSIWQIDNRPDNGYYTYEDQNYYYYHGNWYEWENDSWRYAPDESWMESDYESYYDSYSYDSGAEYDNFQDSSYYSTYDDSSYDSDWDDDSWDSGWDSNDSWDSGYDDWGSDW